MPSITMEPREADYLLEVEGRTFCFNKVAFPKEWVKGVNAFDFRSDDVVVCSYPKTGTMWTLEMMWQILHPDKTPEEPIILRAPFIEMGSVEEIQCPIPGIEMLGQATSPRVIKSHLCPEFFQNNFMDSGVKFVIVTRNPKDALVSYFHFYKNLSPFRFSGSWEEFFALFKEHRLSHGDFFHFYEAWWKLRDHPNVLFISYEELKEDHRKGVKRLANFVSRDVSDEVMDRIISNTSIEGMRAARLFEKAATSKAAQFVRKGIVGDWVNYFTPEQSEYVDKLYAEKLELLGLHMKFKA